MKKISCFIPVLALLCAVSCGGERSMPVVGGEIDLVKGFPSGSVIQCDGEWDFYWNRLAAPSDIASLAAQKTSIHVPALWNGTKICSEIISGKGFATYRMQIKLPYESCLYAFKLLDAATSYRVYVNGHQIAENGVVSEREDGFVPQFRPQVVPFALEKPAEGDVSTVDCVIQVANFAHKKGGLWESVRFGRYDDVIKLREKNLSIELFFLGFMLVMVVYHLGLFLLRRDDRSTLYFGMFVFILALKTALCGERAVSLFFPHLNWYVWARLEYLGAFTNQIFLVLFLYSLFGSHLSSIMKKILVGWGCGIAAAVVFLPLSIVFAVRPVFDLYLFASGLYILPALAYLAVRRIKGGILCFIGMAVMFFTGLNDVLYGSLIVNTFNMASIGTCAFIIVQSFLLSSLFSGAFRRSQEESEKNLRHGEEIRAQNEFIRTVLASASGSVRQSAQKMVEVLDGFRINAHSQAASIEEVAASIEEISAVTQSIAQGTEHQDRSLLSLDEALKKLASLLGETDREGHLAMSVASEISTHAKAGGESISVMKGSMDTINASSSRMNGIIQIINDISDRINLLSLNAAIEAARAGNAGRGFAVVADEISKLADATARSISEIDVLIRTNENEIRKGSENIQSAVISVSKIIDKVESINQAISSVSSYVSTQVELNASVDDEAATVKTISTDIRTAMVGQKHSVSEISNTISSINEMTQNNSIRIEDMTDFAKSLTEMIDSMTMKIETYGQTP